MEEQRRIEEHGQDEHGRTFVIEQMFSQLLEETRKGCRRELKGTL